MSAATRSQDQQGLTLVEILVTLAVSAVIAPMLVSSLFQIARGTVQISEDVVVQLDIDGASNWLSKDLSQAQTTDLADGTCPPGTPATSMRVDWVDQTGWAVEGSAAHYAQYALSGSNLERTYDGAVSIVARHVAAITFCRTGNFITMDITSTYGDKTQALSYYVTPRTEDAFQ